MDERLLSHVLDKYQFKKFDRAGACVLVDEYMFVKTSKEKSKILGSMTSVEKDLVDGMLVDHYIKNGATLENLEIIHSKLRPGTAREYLANIIGERSKTFSILNFFKHDDVGLSKKQDADEFVHAIHARKEIESNARRLAISTSILANNKTLIKRPRYIMSRYID